jgi:sulfite exporter TauE/SafE/copper chaperone CopZ
MSKRAETKILQVAGMTCVNCERRIEKKLKGMPGVLGVKASFAGGCVEIVFDADKAGGREMREELEKIGTLLEELDYRVVKEDGRHRTSDTVLRALWISVALCGLYTILDRFGLLDVFFNFPEAKAGMGYGMLFTVGLLTSVHCVAMCGGINLSQSLPGSDSRPAPRAPEKYAVIRSGLLYNLGRVVSYTVIGGAVGTLGALVSPSGNLRGAVQLAAGVFMVVMGLNMLNVFPWLRRLNLRMPGIFTGRIRAGKSNGPLYVGLLNGFMPCGPLQAMQLYALSTGSFVRGALSMFVFSAGTLPLTFGLSALSSLLSRKFTRGMTTAGAVMVVIMGAAMFGSGMSLSGISFAPGGASSAQTAAQTAPLQVEDNVQLVRTELKPGRYDPIRVQAGIPVRWTIHAEPGTLNGCNYRFVIPEYNGLQKQLAFGDNIVEFTPARTGTFVYSCWMGMIRGRITVVEEDAGAPPPVSREDAGKSADYAAAPASKSWALEKTPLGKSGT